MDDSLFIHLLAGVRVANIGWCNTSKVTQPVRCRYLDQSDSFVFESTKIGDIRVLEEVDRMDIQAISIESHGQIHVFLRKDAPTKSILVPAI